MNYRNLLMSLVAALASMSLYAAECVVRVSKPVEAEAMAGSGALPLCSVTYTIRTDDGNEVQQMFSVASVMRGDQDSAKETQAGLARCDLKYDSLQALLCSNLPAPVDAEGEVTPANDEGDG